MKMERSEWLKIRSSPKKDLRPLRFFHISTDYRWLDVNAGNPNKIRNERFIKVTKGVTYKLGNEPRKAAIL